MYLVIPEYRTEEVVYKTPKVGIKYLFGVIQELDNIPLDEWTAEHLDVWTAHICVYADERIRIFRYERRRRWKMLSCPEFARARRAHKNSAAGRVRSRALRNARLKNATPPWSSNKKMQWFYEEAQRLEAITGIKHHVDHIEPLCGENVCGLNCEFNLTVVPASVNLKKGRKHSSDSI